MIVDLSHVLDPARQGRYAVGAFNIYNMETVDAVLAASRELWTMSRAQRARLPFMHPGRVDVIGAGALVWSDVVSRVRAEVGIAGGRLPSVVVSEHDILDGITLSAAERG